MTAPTKATPQQLEVLAKLANFGWVYHDTALKDGDAQRFIISQYLEVSGTVKVN